MWLSALVFNKVSFSPHWRQIPSIPFFKYILKLCTFPPQVKGVRFVFRVRNAPPSTNPPSTTGKARHLQGVEWNANNFTNSYPYMVD